ncbi:MAG: tetratricopeptide repeat protein [Candidatus Latescibacteria bacterium]|nr:tetratricopeptide repeat protein [Candidatus Latescibacterota bacterium]NIM66436.1 tetratricopeptide repeat protein [Candidatus Latescibacterota bacterium]NIO02916.1 tetratricopeptide repeat protein [Candidatus Latescibacterota bacterium]NIO30051.1 tetratricopeptide repeat protein [Candidatus Latescibacterota bacterium]NIO57666.1 tetratricopeptide repeat protein [Candidatus Latescibacterota bacterium]
MEMRSTHPYQKNLEQIEEEIQAGIWRIAAFVDLVSERKFLRLRTQTINRTTVDPGVLEFLGSSASAISPSNCPQILFATSADGGIELFTPYLRLLQNIPQDFLPLEEMIRTLIETLAHLENYNFFAPHLSPASIGVDEDNRIFILPNAYILPFALSGGHDPAKVEADTQAQLSKSTALTLPATISIHPRAISRFIHLLAPLRKKGAIAALQQEDEFMNIIMESGSSIESGSTVTLSALHEKLFGEPLPQQLIPFSVSRAEMFPALQAEILVQDALDAVSEGHRLIVLKGEAFSGKSTIVELAAEKLSLPENGGWTVLWPDEWNITGKTRKKTVPKGAASSKFLWIIDDATDRALTCSRISKRLEEDISLSETLLLLTIDPARVSKESSAFIDHLKGKFGERVHEFHLPAEYHESDSADKLETPVPEHHKHPPGVTTTRAEHPSVRLQAYLNGIVRYLEPDHRPFKSSSLERLTEEVLGCLMEEERQLLEFVSVAQFAIPLQIALSIFPGSDGKIHRCIHRLAALDLICISYRSNGTGIGVSILLSPKSASIRRLVYRSIPPERRRNLHRTVALHVEERSAFPALFLVHHLLEGEETHLAAEHCVSYLRETRRDNRDALILEHCMKLIHRGLHKALAIADKLFILREASIDLIDKGRSGEAENLLLTAKQNLDEVGIEGRRENAEIASSICRLLADTWESRGEYKRSLDLLSAVREELQSALPLPEQAQLLNDIGWFHYRLGNYENSLECCKLSLTTLNPSQYPLIVAQALNLTGVVQFNTSRYDEAIRYYNRSAMLRENAGDINALSGSYNNLALAYQTKGEYDKALEYYKKSLEIKQRQNNRVGIAAAYLNLALLSYEMHDYEEAEKRCMDSMAISSKLGIAMLTAEIYNTLGAIATVRDQYLEAEKYFLDSLRISRELGSTNVELGSHRRLSTLYLTQKMYAKSREHVEKASELATLIGSKYESAQINMILGDLETEQNKLMEALEYYEKAASAFTTLSNNRLAAAALAKIGLLHARGANTFDAMQYLDRAERQIHSDFGHEVPEEIITLREEIRAHPARTYIAGSQTQNLLKAFYELSLLFEPPFDRNECFRRILDLTRNIIGPDECRLILKREDGRFAVIDAGGREKSLQDEGLTELMNRTLLLGRVLESSSPDALDLAPQIDVGGGGFVCIPLKAIREDLGCLLFYMPQDSLPVSKDNLNFFTALGRHISGILTLMFHLEEHVHKEERLVEEVVALKAQVEDQYRFENLIGKSESMRKIFRTIEKVKDIDTGILIIGESGTGKTELARAIHYNSPRSHKVFQDIHCAQIPESLLESELFGHEKGAFTGAVARKLGLCEKADGGTVFLDDVNVIPMTIQTKLLNFLESKSFNRVGGTKKIHSNVRIIAASNEDLEELCEQGKFRKDLYYRLNVLQIRIPPLRDRKEDIVAIALDYLEKRCSESGVLRKTIAPDAIRILQKAPWEGNVRELQHLIEQIVLLSDDDVIHPGSLPEDFLEKVSESGGQPHKSLEALIQQIIERSTYSKANPLLQQVEPILAKKMVDFVGGKTKAAELLGITKPTLYVRLRDYDRMQ